MIFAIKLGRTEELQKSLERSKCDLEALKKERLARFSIMFSIYFLYVFLAFT